MTVSPTAVYITSRNPSALLTLINTSRAPRRSSSRRLRLSGLRQPGRASRRHRGFRGVRRALAHLLSARLPAPPRAPARAAPGRARDGRDAGGSRRRRVLGPCAGEVARRRAADRAEPGQRSHAARARDDLRHRRVLPQGRREDGDLGPVRGGTPDPGEACSSLSTSSATATARSSAGSARSSWTHRARRSPKSRTSLPVYRTLRRRFVLRTGKPLPAGAYTVRYLVDTERPDLPPQGPIKAATRQRHRRRPADDASLVRLPPARSRALCPPPRGAVRAGGGADHGGDHEPGRHPHTAAHRGRNACPSVRRDRPRYDERHRPPAHAQGRRVPHRGCEEPQVGRHQLHPADAAQRPGWRVDPARASTATTPGSARSTPSGLCESPRTSPGIRSPRPAFMTRRRATSRAGRSTPTTRIRSTWVASPLRPRRSARARTRRPSECCSSSTDA